MRYINTKLTLAVASISGLFAVIFGAFGAHALKSQIETRLFEAYQTGVEYQFYHTFVLMVLAFLFEKKEDSRFLKLSMICFTLGIVLFSGSLYVLAISSFSKLGIVTPIGGICFIFAWFFLLSAVLKDL